jgi:hypothetical protein
LLYQRMEVALVKCLCSGGANVMGMHS